MLAFFRFLLPRVCGDYQRSTLSKLGISEDSLWTVIQVDLALIADSF